MLETPATCQRVALLVEEIISVNPNASVAFLHGFSESDLERYLERLRHAAGPRGDGWRRGPEPPFATRRPAA